MKAYLLGGIALALLTSPLAAQDKVITVWDFKAEPLMQPYFAAVKASFEAAHPGVTIKQVHQPADKYYTILGTAINAGQGPDVVLVHGGKQGTDRAEALVQLDDEVADVLPDLVGLEAFKKDNYYVALPMSVQGVALFYNKAVYQEAGLDPNGPQTWADLSANCKAIIEKTKADCFGLGNKSGGGFQSTIGSVIDGMWDDATRAKFIAGELAWTSDEMKRVWAVAGAMIADGWIKPGSNSYDPYTDTVNQFAGDQIAHMWGLISDATNSWKNLDNLMGDGLLGVVPPPANGRADPHRLTIDGGIGFGVTRWSPEQELALDYVKASVAPENMLVFMESAGGLPSNLAVDTSKLNSAAASKILADLSCCQLAGRIKSYFQPDENQEMVRQGQLLLNGDVTVDAALEAIEAIRVVRLSKAP